jgi:RimJ/RimL family protein N-acetyltransferase
MSHRSPEDATMNSPQAQNSANASIATDKYVLRPLVEGDASDRWASWMSDSEVLYMLNAPARSMTKADIVKYVRTFDQKAHLLLGVFDRQSGRHIGFFTIDVDGAQSQGLVNLLIGEAEFRNRGVLSNVRRQFAEYFFETLGLKTMKATALSHNKIILDTLLKAGWVTEKTLPRHVRAHSDGALLDLCLLSLSRETWRARNGKVSEADAGG